MATAEKTSDVQSLIDRTIKATGVSVPGKPNPKSRTWLMLFLVALLNRLDPDDDDRETPSKFTMPDASDELAPGEMAAMSLERSPASAFDNPGMAQVNRDFDSYKQRVDRLNLHHEKRQEAAAREIADRVLKRPKHNLHEINSGRESL